MTSIAKVLPVIRRIPDDNPRPGAWNGPGASWAVELPGNTLAVSAARAWAGAILHGLPRADDAVLVVSELVTNAWEHSASGEDGRLAVRLETGPDGVKISVIDQGRRAVVRVPVDPGGLGLVIVAALAAAHGSVDTASGRRTWAYLAAEPEPAA